MTDCKLEGGRFYFRIGMYWLAKDKTKWEKILEIPQDKIADLLESKIQETGSVLKALEKIKEEMKLQLRKI